MTDLADFLLARFAEDENVARAVQDVPAKSGSDVFTSLSAPTGTVEMSPRRVLAECEAKRRIVEEHHQLVQYRDEPPCPICPTCSDDPGGSGGSVPFPCPTLGFLALPYADHPDYREEWKP